MARYIDADALKEVIANNVYLVSDCINSRDYGMFWTGGIEKAIDEQPTADVVEVVRCRDCEMFKLQDLSYPKHNTKWCVINGFNPQGGDYCSYGEGRKDE